VARSQLTVRNSNKNRNSKDDRTSRQQPNRPLPFCRVFVGTLEWQEVVTFVLVNWGNVFINADIQLNHAMDTRGMNLRIFQGEPGTSRDVSYSSMTQVLHDLSFLSASALSFSILTTQCSELILRWFFWSCNPLCYAELVPSWCAFEHAPCLPTIRTGLWRRSMATLPGGSKTTCKRTQQKILLRPATDKNCNKIKRALTFWKHSGRTRLSLHPETMNSWRSY